MTEPELLARVEELLAKLERDYHRRPRHEVRDRLKRARGIVEYVRKQLVIPPEYRGRANGRQAWV